MRRATSIILAILGALLAVAGSILAIADHSLFDRGEVQRTTEVIVDDPDVTRLLVREVTNRVVELADLQEQRNIVESIVTVAADDDDVRDELVDAVMVSYRDLRNGADDAIDLNLEDIAAPLRQQAVAFDPSLDDTLPPADELLRFELLDRRDLPQMYDAIETLRKAGWAFILVGLGIVIAAVAMGPSRLAIVAVACGTATAAMFFAVTWISTASDDAVDSVTDPLSRRVARLAVDEYLADLNRLAIGVVIFGVIGVIAGVGGTWLLNAIRPSHRSA